MSHPADQYLHRVGKCTVVQGLPEEVVAMLFGKFSRNPKDFRETLVSMIDSDELVAPPFDGFAIDSKTRKFHERITIGYGHKSVADHAMVHFCLEGVSAVAERDFTGARLIAASSKSTRYVNFAEAGLITPDEWPSWLEDEYSEHCNRLIYSYENLVPLAIDAVRDIIPYDESAKQVWRREKGWESATEKRALDMIRDLLPMSIRTNFGITCSATALREILDKRQTPDNAYPVEVFNLGYDVRQAASQALPVLLPEEPRYVPRQVRPHSKWSDERTPRYSRVELIAKPSWSTVERLTGMTVMELMHRWTNERGHHMVPDRTAEIPEYCFKVMMPIAIHRDLGRHRMMTQLPRALTPALGYGIDPLLGQMSMYNNHPKLAMVAKCHQDAIQFADKQLTAWLSSVPPVALQYACPLATMIDVTWKVNLRELVHLLGLRTTPQGHPSYRQVAQMAALEIKRADPVVRGLIDEVTNFSDVIIGRPG